MSVALGIDTSNYTTSAAVSRDGRITFFRKKLLDVGNGERGLRQSDALFQHVTRLPEILEGISADGTPDAVGVSTKPRDAEGSYMPCFLAGVSAASSAASALGVPLYGFSHQRGHIAAALYSAGREDLLNGRFLAFHLSGGTHELLLCDNGDIKITGKTLDISAGQLIDRVGVATGLGFPCGAEMEKLSAGVLPEVRPVLKGGDCNLSGFENRASDMLRGGNGDRFRNDPRGARKIRKNAGSARRRRRVERLSAVGAYGTLRMHHCRTAFFVRQRGGRCPACRTVPERRGADPAGELK